MDVISKDNLHICKDKCKAWANKLVGRPNRSLHQYLTYSETNETNENKQKETSICKRMGNDSITVRKPVTITANICMKDDSNFSRNPMKQQSTRS